VERLDQVVVRPGPQAADLLLHLALGREHDDRDVTRGSLLRPDLRGHLVAIELREHHVEQDEGRRILRPELEALGTVAGDDDFVALLLEREAQEALDVRVVVDDEDLGGHPTSLVPRVPRGAVIPATA